MQKTLTRVVFFSDPSPMQTPGAEPVSVTVRAAAPMMLVPKAPGFRCLQTVNAPVVQFALLVHAWAGGPSKVPSPLAQKPQNTLMFAPMSAAVLVWGPVVR